MQLLVVSIVKTDRTFKKGYRYRFYPTDEQRILLEKTFGCCRFVYNKGLAESIQEYEEYKQAKVNGLETFTKPIITGFNLANKLPSYKANPEYKFLKEISAVALQQVMFSLGNAYSNFFKLRKGYPKFKSKSNHQAFTLSSQAFSFENEKCYIQKSKDPLDIHFHRQLPSNPTSCVISKTLTGKYFISFICEYVPVTTTGTGMIGIDLGLKDFIVSSSGERVPNPKHLKMRNKHLRRLQQTLSRKKKGSKNRNKARIQVALQHEKISDCRNDFHHKLSRKLINENQVIGVEKLMVRNMVKNHRLAKSIYDAGWNSFISKLLYKAVESQHCNIVQMSHKFPSSHICSNTDMKLDRKLFLSERSWKCPHCGETHDRDLNAALNIRNKAISVLAIHQIPPSGTLVLAGE